MARTHFDTPPAEYDRMRSGHHGRHRIELFLEAVTGCPEGATIVEMGSATGFTLEALATARPDCRFVGVEIAPELHEYAATTHQRPNVEFVEGSIESFASDEPVELVISADVIHHVHDHAAAFAAVRRLLRPGGRWVVVEPNIWQPYISLAQEKMKRTGYDEDHFRPWRLDPLLRAAGFTIDRREYRHLLPAVRANPSRFEVRAERLLERFRVLGGSVVYQLTATTPSGP